MASTSYVDFTAGLREIPNRTDAAGVAAEDLPLREDALVNELLTAGVVKPDGAFAPSKGTGDFDVDIGSGSANADVFVVVSTVTGQPPYLVQLKQTSLTVTLDASDADARIDEVYLVVRDDGMDSNADGHRLPRVAVRKGDASTSPLAPGPDSEWVNYALIASVSVAGGAPSITADDITDERVAAHLKHMPPGLMSATAGSSAPAGWVVADGQSLSRSAYWRLFSVIGTTYGAPTADTFNVPDARDRTLVGAGGQYALGATFGADSVVLTSAEMPSHTHSQGNASTNSHAHSQSSTGSDSHAHSQGTTGSDSHGHSVNVMETNESNHTHVANSTDGQVAGKPTFAGSNVDTTGPISSESHAHTNPNTNSDSHSHANPNTNTQSHAHTNPDTNSTGGDGSHENRQPSLAVTPLISI